MTAVLERQTEKPQFANEGTPAGGLVQNTRMFLCLDSSPGRSGKTTFRDNWFSSPKFTTARDFRLPTMGASNKKRLQSKFS